MTFTAQTEHDVFGKINLPRCTDRVCSKATNTPRKWNREKHDENEHKRDIFSTKTTNLPT